MKKLTPLELFIIGIEIIVILALSFILFIYVGWIDIQFQADSTQLIVEIAGFFMTAFGIGLAIREFGLSQRKPDLDLLFQDVDGSLSQTLLLDRPKKANASFHNVKLVLRNKSNGVAEFIKIRVDFQNLDQYAEGKYDGNVIAYNQSLWDKKLIDHARVQISFNGGRDFIHYPFDEEIIGEPIIAVIKDGSPKRCPVLYQIRAQGMKRKDGQLFIEIPSSPEG